MKFVFGQTTDFQREVQRAKLRYRQDRLKAARYATDRAARQSKARVAEAMRGAGLGNLGGGIGTTSALRKRADGTWAVMYARGQGNETEDGSRTAGAIEAYTQGTVITPKGGGAWLAFQTNVIPRKVGRRRMTPALYRTSGWEQRLGKLMFRPISANEALLVARNVTVHPVTGRGKAAGKRRSRTRIHEAEVVVFVLIRYTARLARVNEKTIAASENDRVPIYLGEALDQIQRGETPRMAP